VRGTLMGYRILTLALSQRERERMVGSTYPLVALITRTGFPCKNA
jgi:hypothetical protein